MRTAGWTLISLGIVVLLYLVYLLFFTNLQNQRAQNDLLDRWGLEFGDPDDRLPGEGTPGPHEPVDPGDAYAVMWFERPGSTVRPVHEEDLYIVEGVSLDDLKRGPGHYATTAAPGGRGNFAVSGHRTTYGAPFYHLETLVAGDEIHVVDRELREWVYIVREQQIVGPSDTWVLGDDPLNTGERMLTLTTCHPRFSAQQRLIVFAELQLPEKSGGAT